MYSEYRLTPKKSKLITAYMLSGDHYLAAKKAGYGEKAARDIHTTVFQEVAVRQAIQSAEDKEFDEGEFDNDDYYINSGLTPQLALLALECSVEDNMRQAAINAGFNPLLIRDLCDEALRNPKFHEAIKMHTSAKIKRIGLSQDRLIGELMRIAFSNIGDFVKDDWDLKDKNNVDAESMFAVSEVKIQETKFGVNKTIKLHSKTTALTLLSEHLGIIKVKDTDIAMNEKDKEPISDTEILEKAKAFAEATMRNK